jgi:hypothetical protein
MTKLAMIFPAALPAPRVSLAEAPVPYTVLVLLLAVGIAATVRLHQLARRSQQDRIDVRAGETVFSGISFVWQQKMLDPRNYRPGVGVSIIRGIVVCIAIQFLAFAAACLVAVWTIL